MFTVKYIIRRAIRPLNLRGQKTLKIKAVIFDLDGTIVRFNIDYMAVRAETRSVLISYGLPASILQLSESIFDMLEKAEIFLRNNRAPEKLFNDIRRAVLAIAEKYEFEAASNTSLTPHVVETLEELRNMNLKIGLCTVNSERATGFLLKRFGIAQYFTAVVSRNLVRRVKPNVEHLQMTLKLLGVYGEETLLVGDGARDMECANELKVIAVGITTGVSSKQELATSGANYLVTSLTELPRLVEHIDSILKDLSPRS
jgi:HAD superfamily hydrolase (TIGR01549 family)